MCIRDSIDSQRRTHARREPQTAAGTAELPSADWRCNLLLSAGWRCNLYYALRTEGFEETDGLQAAGWRCNLLPSAGWRCNLLLRSADNCLLRAHTLTIRLHTEAVRLHTLSLPSSVQEKAHGPYLDFVAIAFQNKAVGFKEVLKMIDNKVAALKKEQLIDDEKKAGCTRNPVAAVVFDSCLPCARETRCLPAASTLPELLKQLGDHAAQVLARKHSRFARHLQRVAGSKTMAELIVFTGKVDLNFLRSAHALSGASQPTASQSAQQAALEMAAHTAKANYRKAWMIQRRINGNRDHYANLTAEDQYLVKTLEPHLVPHPRWHANLRQDARCEDHHARC